MRTLHLIPSFHFCPQIDSCSCLHWATQAPVTHPGGQPRSPQSLQGVPVLSCCPDLKTMTERLRSRYYVTRKLFVADLQRVIANCREYNPPDSEYCRCASALEKFFYFKLKEGGLIDK